MIILLAAALLVDFTPPREGGEAFRDAVLADAARSTPYRGSAAGNWYLAAGGDRSRLRVEDFECRQPAGRRNCRFTLIREGGPVELRGAMVPDRLTCTARFRRGRDGRWFVDQMSALRRAGNIDTTMRCQGA
ncbi:hypothetical protein CFHF_14895 [Caulobacter flavus]|uniref:Uncharacterized protein n=1 Tax=Caulobacter flavus TaxID=1679497 RepID=A0A2N5CRV1_9CAUL|nr:hypothetical protein [Caulobacter flavus]AYV46426.1 hypothetical protein C1707_09210 [Caulobacter flavus]PLR12723.1 hypothetical protein CFHF_14895 [Caulobacter flavus]